MCRSRAGPSTPPPSVPIMEPRPGGRPDGPHEFQCVIGRVVNVRFRRFRMESRCTPPTSDSVPSRAPASETPGGSTGELSGPCHCYSRRRGGGPPRQQGLTPPTPHQRPLVVSPLCLSSSAPPCRRCFLSEENSAAPPRCPGPRSSRKNRPPLALVVRRRDKRAFRLSPLAGQRGDGSVRFTPLRAFVTRGCGLPYLAPWRLIMIARNSWTVAADSTSRCRCRHLFRSRYHCRCRSHRRRRRRPRRRPTLALRALSSRHRQSRDCKTI